MTLALRGGGHLEDNEMDLDNIPQLVGEELEDDNELAWVYKIGPQGGTKFNECYETWRAKNKKRKESPCRREWFRMWSGCNWRLAANYESRTKRC